MRLFLAIVGALLLAQCATGEDDRFRVGESPRSFVIIGVAESGANTAPNYTMLWRRLDADGGFTEYDDDTIFEPRTHARGSVRVRGIPGEFVMAEVEPGVYALDSVFAVVRGDRINYSANGVIVGPERPAFDVRPGEAIYLGIWEMDLEEVRPVARPWRLDQADVQAALRRRSPIIGIPSLRETYTRTAPCEPRQLHLRSRRQVC